MAMLHQGVNKLVEKTKNQKTTTTTIHKTIWLAVGMGSSIGQLLFWLPKRHFKNEMLLFLSENIVHCIHQTTLSINELMMTCLDGMGNNRFDLIILCQQDLIIELQIKGKNKWCFPHSMCWPSISIFPLSTLSNVHKADKSNRKNVRKNRVRDSSISQTAVKIKTQIPKFHSQQFFYSSSVL